MKLNSVFLSDNFLLGSNTSNAAPEKEAQTASLFTSFLGDSDGLHLAKSEDTRHGKDLGGAFVTPNVGATLMRDPPLEPLNKPAANPSSGRSGAVRGEDHHSIMRIPEKDEWIIEYHCLRISDGYGFKRETYVFPMLHAEYSSILPVDVFEAVPTLSPR